MKDQSRLKQLLLEQLTRRNAHILFDDAVGGLDPKDIGTRPQGLPHSIWELAEHIRIAQHDILDFSRNPDYHPLDWPDDYWPTSQKPDNQQQWTHTIESYHHDQKAMAEFIDQTDTDLTKPLNHGSGQTLFREVMLIVDHNSYHIGQIVQIRRLLGIWT